MNPYRTAEYRTQDYIFKGNPAAPRWDGLFRLHDIQECERRIAQVVADHRDYCFERRRRGASTLSWTDVDVQRVRREVYGSYDGFGGAK